MTEWPGMIAGQGVIDIHRNKKGDVVRQYFEYSEYVYLTVMPHELGAKGLSATNAKTDAFWIVDDSRTKVSLVDEHRVYVAFDRLQKLLLMDAVGDDPARANEIQISLKDGADLAAARRKIEKIKDEVFAAKARELGIKSAGEMAREQAEAEAKQRGLAESATQKLIADRVKLAQELERDSGAGARIELARLQGQFGAEVQTWQELHRTYLSAIENEKGLMVILFAIISLVAVFMIFCIFYMVVAEKTRDIGTIKAVGAPSYGIAQIFVGYGTVIGVIGGLLGFLFSYAIVHNINELHGWLAAHGWVIWNPEVYLFDTIPNRMNPREVIIVVAIAISSSIAGALLPAIKAAAKQPVESLRWE